MRFHSNMQYFCYQKTKFPLFGTLEGLNLNKYTYHESAAMSPAIGYGPQIFFRSHPQGVHGQSFLAISSVKTLEHLLLICRQKIIVIRSSNLGPQLNFDYSMSDDFKVKSFTAVNNTVLFIQNKLSKIDLLGILGGCLI